MDKWWTREYIHHDLIVDSEARKKVIDITVLDMGNLDDDIFWEDFAVSELFRTTLSREHDVFIFFCELVKHGDDELCVKSVGIIGNFLGNQI